MWVQGPDCEALAACLQDLADSLVSKLATYASEREGVCLGRPPGRRNADPRLCPPGASLQIPVSETRLTGGPLPARWYHGGGRMGPADGSAVSTVRPSTGAANGARILERAKYGARGHCPAVRPAGTERITT